MRVFLLLILLAGIVAPPSRATLPLLDHRCIASGRFTSVRKPVTVGEFALDGYFWKFTATGTCNHVAGARDIAISGVPFPGYGLGYTFAPFAIYSPFLTTTTVTTRKTGVVRKFKQAWFFDSPTEIHVGPLYGVRIYEAVPAKNPTTIGNQTGLGALIRVPPKRTATGSTDAGPILFVFGMSIPVGPVPKPTPTVPPIPTPSPTGLPTELPSPTPSPTVPPIPTPSPTGLPTELPSPTPSPTGEPTEPTPSPSPT